MSVAQNRSEKLRPLERRVYKYKNPKMNFFCPLCRSERALVYSYRLSWINYVQIAVATTFLMWVLYPIMEEKSFFIFFVSWGILEFGMRLAYRRQIPCPYCGFDAAWYKQDVRVARRLVNEFWGRDIDDTPLLRPESTSTEKEKASPA